jgi:septation ring formation regulator EzrA
MMFKRILSSLTDDRRGVTQIIGRLNRMENNFMAKIDEVIGRMDAALERERKQTNVVDALKGILTAKDELNAALKAEIEALKAAGGASEAQLQTVLDKFNEIEQLDLSDDAKVAEIVTANTPVNTDGTVPQPTPDA